MRYWLQLIGWLACVVYSTIPAFWLMIHPFAERWRARRRSRLPAVLLPAWMAMWVVVALATRPWRASCSIERTGLGFAAALLFACGLYLYSQVRARISARKQLGGLPEVHGRNREQRLVTDGIRVARAASGVSGASLRDAGVEHRDRPRRVLGADGVRGGHGSGDDPDGGCGVGEEVWRLLPRLSQRRSSGSAKSVLAFASYNPT